MADPRRSLADSLGFKAATGVGWNLAGVLVRSAAAFCVNIVLARLLGPQPFGLVALSMVVITLGNLLVDSGLSVQLIREPAISPESIRGVFTLQVLVGLVLASGVILSTPALSALFKQSDAAPVLRALALMLVITSAGQPSTALLRRELRFKTIQKIQILSYLVGYVGLGLPLAFGGAGVWALVWAQLAQATLGTILSWALVRHSLLPWLGAESRNLLRFGSFLAGSNVACWSFSAIPNFLIGRTLGPGALGFYNRASSLAGLPATTLIPPVQTVALSFFSRLQENNGTNAKALRAVISISALAVFPPSLLIAGSALAGVQVVLGAAWLGAVPVFLPLACAMCFDSVAALCSTFLVSCGRPDLDFRTQAAAACSGAAGLAIAASCGASIAALAWTVCLGLYLVRAVVAGAYVRKVAGVSLAQLGSALRAGVLLGVAAFSTAQLAALVLRAAPAWVRLTASCTGAICAGVILVLLVPQMLISADLLWSIRRSGVPIPGIVEPWLDYLQTRIEPVSTYCRDDLT